MEGFIHDAYTLKALKQVRLGRSFFITGKAGTGKTTLLKEIVKECRARGKTSMDRAIEDIEQGRVYKYDSLDDLIKEIEG